MSATRPTFLLLIAWVITARTNAQVPLTPAWTHIDAFGAGDWYPYGDVFSTAVAFDPSSGAIYRTITENPSSGDYMVQVFDTDGFAVNSTPPLVFHGVPSTLDAIVTKVDHLSAHDNELMAIVRFSPNDWMKVIDPMGEPVFLVGLENENMVDFHRDASGTIVQSTNTLRTYSSSGWPLGTVQVDEAEDMTVFSGSIVLGLPPEIMHIDRGSLSLLPPILVPANGSATSGLVSANGNSSFNYVALNSNNTLDVGLADVNSGSVWSTTITITAGARLTASHTDELGNFWVATVQNNAALLYRFTYTPGPYAVGNYSRMIDGIASGDGKLFLTGRMAGSSTDTYLAAFDMDMMTGMSMISSTTLNLSPNPADAHLVVQGINAWVHAWIGDATGKRIKEISPDELATGHLSVSELAVGSYRLFLRNEHGGAQLPFVITR